MTAHWSTALKRLGACEDAVMWARGYSTPGRAWRACERADWMLWIAGRLAGPPGADSRKPVVMAACACARTALEFVPAGEVGPLRAIETVEAWCAGRASLNEVLAAADAAADDAATHAASAASFAALAAHAAAADAASYAASSAAAARAAAYAAAAYAVASASADAAASAHAAYAAASAYAADAASAYAAIRLDALASMAVLVRQHLPCPKLPSATKKRTNT